ncbi:MAG TPA: hypothetical protein VGI06_10935 [Acidimicrobiales bacterium]|jgi:hypothetical protein
MHALVLGALSWDPQLRGALIVLVAILVLPGSVYLLLATNLGARVGFLVAMAGLSGWMLLLNIIWLMAPLGTGPIGYKGAANGWEVKEIVQGDLVTHSALKVVTGTPGKPGTQFPNGWTRLPPGNSILASASPVVDSALIPPAATAAPAKTAPAFPPPFKTTQDYVEVAFYNYGGHSYLFNLFGYKVFWRIRHHQIFLKHQPHWVIEQVAPALPSVTLLGAAATLPAADVTKPTYSVVMLRSEGSLRLPPILIGFGSLIIFGLTCENLHSRDKEIRRRKAEEEGGGGGGSPGSTPTPRPAGELQPA